MPHESSDDGPISELGEKIASELVFAEAGKDTGLLPVNSFLCLIEEALSKEAAPEPIAQGVQLARRWMDQVFDATGTFREADLERFGRWAAWWKTALEAFSKKRELPVLTESEDAVKETVIAKTAPGATSHCSRGKAGTPLPGPLPAPRGEGIGELHGGIVETRPSAAGPTPAATSVGEPVLTLNLEQDGEFLAQFISESKEHLQNIEQGVLMLENNPSDADTLNLIFRAFHTFKGGSGFLNLTAIQNLAHELESLLDLARQHKLAITRPVIDLILAGADTLKEFVVEISAHLAGEKRPGPIVVPTVELLASIRAALACPVEAMVRAAVAFPNLPQPATEFDTMTDIVSATVKVDKVKLDNLVDLMGELVLAQSSVVQNVDGGVLRDEKLNRDLARLNRITRDLKYTAMSLRMVPIRKTFQKMSRLVRDVAAKAGKNAQLLTQGEETELDRALVEEINDPLIHMIRNSVDHGLEKPEVRRERGKPERGVILLNAFHQGGSVVIEIKDDGNGLDCERILAKASKMGLVKPGQELPEKEIFNLIMAPGFSTAEQLTDLSGRGVGLDVVRRNVENLHGKIEIRSTPGHGSTFTIHLPLTMAIIDGLIAGVGEQRFIIPTLSVGHSFRPAAGAVKTVQGRGEMIEVRGKLRPLLRLYAHLGVRPASTVATECIAVLIESGGQSRCVLVDQLLGKQEVVTKSLGETFQRSRCVSGAAILGDGRVALILDPSALVSLETAPLEAAA